MIHTEFSNYLLTMLLFELSPCDLIGVKMKSKGGPLDLKQPYRARHGISQGHQAHKNKPRIHLAAAAEASNQSQEDARNRSDDDLKVTENKRNKKVKQITLGVGFFLFSVMVGCRLEKLGWRFFF